MEGPEIPFMPKAVMPEQDPSTHLTLQGSTLKFIIIERESVVLRFIPDGLALCIDVPWNQLDFRLMIQGWLNKLAHAEDNGSAQAPEV